MKAVQVLQIVLLGALGVVILLPMLALMPIGGFGSLPFLGSAAVPFTTVLAPLLVILLVATLFVTGGDAGDVRSEWSTQDAPTQSQAASRELQPKAEYDGKNPLEILQDRYASGELSHHEYERRLQVLLDADDADELRARLDGLDDHDRETLDEEFLEVLEREIDALEAAE